MRDANHFGWPSVYWGGKCSVVNDAHAYCSIGESIESEINDLFGDGWLDLDMWQMIF